MAQEQIDVLKMNRELQELKMKFEKLKEDLEFAMSTEEAWKEVDEGKAKKMSPEDFLNELNAL